MINRRFFVAGAATALILPPLPTLALTANGASQLVDGLVADINGVIASGKGENAMFRDFERIFARYSDTSYIAAYAMGVDGRRASNAQKRAFSNAFQAYISRKYGKRFREFIGGR
ncbi:MAG: ABC transporter substrate-binding protein, partial [Pseudomonadota bacterium]